MIELERDILSLTDFKRNTNEFIKQMKEIESPLVLTVNGKAALVVQDAASYEAIRARLEEREAVTGIRRGLEQMERGEGLAVDEAFARFRAKYGLANGWQLPHYYPA